LNKTLIGDTQWAKSPKKQSEGVRECSVAEPIKKSSYKKTIVYSLQKLDVFFLCIKD